MHLVDFKNDFNMIDTGNMLEKVKVRCSFMSSWMEFLYRQSAKLFLGSGFIRSAHCI